MNLAEAKEGIGYKLDSVIETLAELTKQTTDSKMFEIIAKALATTIRARALTKYISEQSSKITFTDSLATE